METIDKKDPTVDYNDWVGKTVEKKSGRPFKSGKKIGLVEVLAVNPHSTNTSFKMVEDGTVVDCHQCRLVSDFRKDWFFQQHYSPAELDQLWEWCEKFGMKMNVTFNSSFNQWTAHHVGDQEMKIDLGAQKEMQDCINWVHRMGFSVANEKDLPENDE